MLTEFITEHLIVIGTVLAIVVVAIAGLRVSIHRKQALEPGQRSKQALAKKYSKLGNTCFINNELEKAQDYYTKALEINEQLGKKEPIAKNYINLGMVLSKKGQPEQARSYWVKATDIFTETGKTDDVNVPDKIN